MDKHTYVVKSKERRGRSKSAVRIQHNTRSDINVNIKQYKRKHRSQTSGPIRRRASNKTPACDEHMERAERKRDMTTSQRNSPHGKDSRKRSEAV